MLCTHTVHLNLKIMIILISGATHSGKTFLASKLMEKLSMPYLSLDYLKMGLIRSGQVKLLPEDDEKIKHKMWPIVREMIKTVIENHQNLIIEGDYIPFEFQKDFSTAYLKEIRFLCLILSQNYIKHNFSQIKNNACVIEKRLFPDIVNTKELISDNQHHFDECRRYNLTCAVIEKDFQKELCAVLDRFPY